MNEKKKQQQQQQKKTLEVKHYITLNKKYHNSTVKVPTWNDQLYN